MAKLEFSPSLFPVSTIFFFLQQLLWHAIENALVIYWLIYLINNKLLYRQGSGASVQSLNVVQWVLYSFSLQLVSFAESPIIVAFALVVEGEDSLPSLSHYLLFLGFNCRLGIDPATKYLYPFVPTVARYAKDHKSQGKIVLPRQCIRLKYMYNGEEKSIIGSAVQFTLILSHQSKQKMTLEDRCGYR